jgi:hypothetical protein
MHLKGIIIGAFGAALLFAAAPASAGALSSPASLGDDGASASSLIPTVSHGVPAGARCVKWTRRWNMRHGFGHRRCVQWR